MEYEMTDIDHEGTKGDLKNDPITLQEGEAEGTATITWEPDTSDEAFLIVDSETIKIEIDTDNPPRIGQDYNPDWLEDD